MEVSFNGFRRQLTNAYNKLVQTLKDANDQEEFQNLGAIEAELEEVRNLISMLNCFEEEEKFTSMSKELIVDSFKK